MKNLIIIFLLTFTDNAFANDNETLCNAFLFEDEQEAQYYYEDELNQEDLIPRMRKLKIQDEKDDDEVLFYWINEMLKNKKRIHR